MSQNQPADSLRSWKIGFVGLGVMGAPMAHNLLNAGASLVVNTRTQQRASSLIEAGATWAANPADVARAVDYVITMLPDSPDVAAVMSGTDGILSAASRGLTWIDMSTISPEVARRLASDAMAKGVESLDGPVSGGEVGARTGALSIMVGGSADIVERCRPILSVLGSRIVHCGSSGAGQVVKACNQLVVGGTIGLVCEALMLGSRAGVDPKQVREALQGGFASSRVLDVHGQRILDANFTPGFRLSLHCKDMRIATETAKAAGSPSPLGASVADLMNAALAQGLGDKDHSGLYVLYATLAGRPANQSPENAC